MYFTSYGFILFLIIVFAGYYTIFSKFKWQFLLAASIVFYAFSGLSNLVYIFATVISTYIVSRRLAVLHEKQEAYLKDYRETLSKEEIKGYKSAEKSKRRKWLVSCLVFNFGVLAAVKYADFMIFNINALTGAFGGKPLGFLGLVLPLGISFYTFQTMGYIIDVFRGKRPAEKNIFKLALFTSFFPQLIQGPISRFDDLREGLFAGRERRFDKDTFSHGIMRVLWGFFKKLVIADRLLVAVKTLVGDTAAYRGAYVLAAMLFYAVTLYADFTGGIDITIGVAEALGIRLKENFDRPFYSKSIAEYWRRWHITMGAWFRDYVFYPVSVSRPILKLLKFAKKVLGDGLGKRAPVYASTLVVWFLTGLWHGSSWNFIAWGLANGIVIVISQELSPLYAKFHKRYSVGEKAAYKAFQIFRTFWLMCFIRTFDIYSGVGTTFKMFGSVFTGAGFGNFTLSGLGLGASDYIIAALGVAVMIIAGQTKKPSKPATRYIAAAALGIAVIIFGHYGFGYDATQFIYNQF